MKIFKPQNEKGENLVPLTIETEKIDNKYLDLTNLSEQLAETGSLKDKLSVLDIRVGVNEKYAQEFFGDRYPDGNVEEGETLDDILGKLDNHNSEIDNLEETLYGKTELVGKVDSFNGTYTIPFAGFEISPHAGHVPTKLKSFILHDIQNAVTLEEPLVAISNNGVTSNKVYSWNEGDDIEFIFDEIIDTTTLEKVNIILVPNPNGVDPTKLPEVKLDRNISYDWWNNAKGNNAGSGAWTGEWRRYAPNMSFRYEGLTARVDDLQSTLPDVINSTIESKDFVTHPEIANFITEGSLAGIKDDITNLQNSKADKSELNNKADRTDLNSYVTKTELQQGVSTKQLTVTGGTNEESVTFNGTSQANLNLGYHSILGSGCNTSGTITLGGKSDISNSTHSGIVLSGSQSSVGFDSDIRGNYFAGMDSIISGSYLRGFTSLGFNSNVTGGVFNGTVSLGDTTTVTGGTFYSTIDLGYSSKVNGGKFYGNLIAGSNVSFGGDITESRNFWSIGGTNSNLKAQLENRYGIIFIGSGSDNLIYSPSKAMQILLPNEKKYAAKVSGWEKWENDFNVVDASGTEIIKDGVLTVTGSLDEEELDRILATKGYLTSSDLDNYVTSDEISNFVTNEQVTAAITEKTQNFVTQENVQQIVSDEIGPIVDSTVDKKLENKLFEYITYDDFIRQTEDFTSKDYISSQKFIKCNDASEMRIYTSEDDLPPLEEREDGVLYIAKAKDDSSKLFEELDQRIKALETKLQAVESENNSLKSYIESNFIKGAVKDEVTPEEENKEGYAFFIPPTEN